MSMTTTDLHILQPVPTFCWEEYAYTQDQFLPSLEDKDLPSPTSHPQKSEVLPCLPAWKY